jgi:tetratricopeptide (TPR) repeat protein
MLEHPAIARAIDGGATESGALYLVMEYVENGCPIDEFNPSAPVRDKIRLFLRVVEAVESAHRLQIAHRDLKPSNILVTPAGQPKVLDFGIAKLIQPEAPAADQTDAANSALTPTYASPEQLLREPATLLSDIYSLGAVLYKMLAARPPHELTGLNLIQTVRKVTESEPAPPSTFVPGIGADLDAIIGKALDRNPARRYVSATDLAADLRCYLDGFPVAARKGAHWYRATRFVRRHRGATVAAAICLTLLAAAGLKTARDWQLARQRHEQLRKSAPSVIADYNSQLTRLTGNTSLLNQLASEEKKYLDGIYAEASNDTSLRRELAGGYFALAGHQTARIEAHESLQKAAALWRETALDKGTDADRLQLAISLRRLGWSAINMGQVKDARRALDEAIPLLDALDATPARQPAEQERIKLYFEYSRLSASSGDGAKAIEFAQKAVEVHEKLPQGSFSGTGVAFTRLQLADTIETFASGNPKLSDIALAQTRLAVRAVRQAPPCLDLPCREAKAAILTRAPIVLIHRHLVPEALALRDGVDLAEAILVEDPGNRSALLSLRFGLRYLGWLLDDVGRLDECLRVLRRHLEVSVLSDRYPGPTEGRLAEAVACNGLGRLLMRMNRLQEAQGYFDRQVEIVDHPPNENVYWFMRQTEAYQDLGRLRLRMGQPEAARAEFAKGSAAAATFLAKTGSARAKAIQAELHFFHGDSLLAVDKPAGCALLRRSINQYDELAKAAGGPSSEWKPTYDDLVNIFRKRCPAA